MRTMQKRLIGIITATGIAATCLATAGTSFAASAPETKPTAVGAEAVAPLAVVNLGLTTSEAKNVQSFLRAYYSYTGAIDGQLGTQSWKAMQRMLKKYGYTGKIDGVVGGGTVQALQRLLRTYGYDGSIDGVVGPKTLAAFKTFGRNIF
ncbi:MULTISPECIES: peptidoglycan-binding protein [unclassified Streptomyces]|uniref:peptidoglycan-binding domain-containing protein n=1 Tax=unclassified Streptomyces TaxID=2593676 RepID=UPI0007839CB8|nr:peptidoglycan-binding protein [Streptomyces sp. AVP053U2]